MSKRIIEETFRAITPRGRRGIPDPPVVAAGFGSGPGSGASGSATGGSSELSTSLSQAGQQIASLQSAYQQQAALISANTQAIQSNTSAQGGRGSAVGSAASSILGGALGFLSPVISGIASLFGGGPSTPAPLPIYIPPSPVQVSGTLTAAHAVASSQPGQMPQVQGTSPIPPVAQSSSIANVTVNVSAMDSQSFMDRSNDIASAVREAMLNLHPINDVIASL